MAYTFDQGTPINISLSNFLHVVRAKQGPTSKGDTSGYTVALSTHSLAAATINRLPHSLSKSPDVALLEMSVWIPAAIVEHALPHLMQDKKMRKTACHAPKSKVSHASQSPDSN